MSNPSIVPGPIAAGADALLRTIFPPNNWTLGGLSFDSWLKLNHTSRTIVTQHPVETGSPVNDNAYNEPLRFSFEIGMSDATYNVFSGQFPLSPSRLITAYQSLLAMQQARNPVPLVTKYATYQNVMIESIDVHDDANTLHVLRATVNLMQIITVSTTIVAVSSSQQVTVNTNSGVVNVQPAYLTAQQQQAAAGTDLGKDLQQLGQ
jgi:hypothetical protein